MKILGVAGGPNIVGADPIVSGISPLFFHDSAACLLVDGEVVCAFEEERLSRIKHTNAFPVLAIQACLDSLKLTFTEIDSIAYFFGEAFCDEELRRVSPESGGEPVISARAMVDRNLLQAFGERRLAKLVSFVKHHEAHAAAAHHASQFSDCLIVVVDGRGENESISVLRGKGQTSREILISYPVDASPGFFFRKATKLLGFGDHDEYKVMGLAPYGDPHRFRRVLRRLYQRPEHGSSLVLNHEGLESVARSAGVFRQSSQTPINQNHKDFAAAVQEMIEDTISDVVNLWQKTTRARHLCLVGGVAHNCRANGVIARSGKFDAIYVHPASHDAGAAIGAALSVEDSESSSQYGRQTRKFSPFLGTSISVEGDSESQRALVGWMSSLKWHRPQDLHETVAKSIADGEIVAWARGRAEFGPRALGARSILADPRPRSNWERINTVIKKREGFRPFAPSVCEESANKYFEMPAARCNLGEMGFTVPVRHEWRSTLGAVTHIDGSARVQVVTLQDNPDFWKLIVAFGRLTGISVLLNTSFNHSSEPIVDSAYDAVRTFLTTNVDCLVLGPYFVRKHGSVVDQLSRCHLLITRGTEFMHLHISNNESRGTLQRGNEVIALSQTLTSILSRDKTRLDNVLGGGIQDEADALLRAEVMHLWENRMVDVLPSTDHD